MKHKQDLARNSAERRERLRQIAKDELYGNKNINYRKHVTS
ncbi:hypothetical protein [Leuconostoc citreum]